MSWLSKKAAPVIKAAVNPVGAAIEKATGISAADQLKMGAAIGTGGLLYRGLSRPGPTGVGPVANGDVYSASMNPVQSGSGSGSGFNWGNAAMGMLPSLIGAGAGIYSAQQNAAGIGDANEASLTSAREQMSFQERMSSTAHQREVADLKAAGLNPTLSANAGASTPVGASVDVENSRPNYSNVVASAMQASQVAKSIQEADSRIDNNAAYSAKTRAEKGLVDVNRKIADADFYKASKENEFIQNNPWYIPASKLMPLFGTAVGSARDAGILFRSLKGFGSDDKPGPKRDSGADTIYPGGR